MSTSSSSSVAASALFSVTVHPFQSPTPYSCAYELASSPSTQNALVFIGGLGDGPHTVPYIRTIAEKIQSATGLDYSVFETRLRSSFSGFGHQRLGDDVADISALVKHLRGIGKQKVVLMGHSTGCQDCVEYANDKHSSEHVDGFILQAPVSDREAIKPLMSEEAYKESIDHAVDMIKSGQDNEIMPRSKMPEFFDSPITAFRWFSLAGKGGEDDVFSSDLSDDEVQAVWGRFKQPVLIVPSGSDEHVPEDVDVAGRMQRWMSFSAPGIVSEFSGLIPGASHNVKQAESREWLADRVIKFLESLQR